VDDEARDLLKDSFARDMAEHQRMTGKMPTPAENARLAVPVFERLEQKQAAQAARAADDVADRRSDEDRAADRKRELERRGASESAERARLVRLPDKEPIAVAANPEDLELGLRMLRRLELLLTKPEKGIGGTPSWRERALAVVALRHFGGDKRRAAEELGQLCEDSIPAFGPWDVPEGEGRPLIFT
jgi:hypothetical protein